MVPHPQRPSADIRPLAGLDKHSPAHLKLALFLSRFRGREDVYARRFESRRTGKSGYAPACSNEWVRGLCEKPRIACADCPNRRFLVVDDDVIRWHLTGLDAAGNPFVLGVYPLLQDERCHFLVADFDGEDWAKDALAFMETCKRHLPTRNLQTRLIPFGRMTPCHRSSKN